MNQRQVTKALAGLLPGMFVAVLAANIVAAALPTIMRALHAGQTVYTWTVVATLLAATVATPVWGKLADLTSKRTLVQIALLVFSLGTLGSGFAQNPEMLLVSRVIQGIGSGGMMALAQIIMAAMIPPRERGRYSGYLGAVLALATVAGPLVGGLIVDTSWLGWRWVFFVSVPIALASLVVLRRTLHLPASSHEVRVDWAGVTLITAAVSLLLIWVSFAGDAYDWLSWQTAVMAGGAVVLAVLFVAVEARAAEPIIPLRLFRDRIVSLSAAASLLIGMAMFGVPTFLSQYFQMARGQSPTAAGLSTLPMIVGLLIGSTGSGRLITRTGHWKVFLVAGSASLAVGLALLGTDRYDTAYWQLAVGMLLVGAGVGMTQQNLVLAVQNRVTSGDLGAASSSVSFFRSLGGALGLGVLGAVLSHRIAAYATEGAGRQAAYGHGLADLFLYMAPAVVLSLLAVLAIREVPLRMAGGPAEDSRPSHGRHARRGNSATP
ncbi:MFS transporter [Streptomyces sp. NPDC046805]|uniref:MFS transporter n=1 Tax=Streptomyces sp. NPDC046805 TaxID=3155134 RepID=UPI00340BD9D1